MKTTAYRIELWGDQVEALAQIDPLFGTVKQSYGRLPIYPKTHYVMKPETQAGAVDSILKELEWWEASWRTRGDWWNRNGCTSEHGSIWR